MNAYLELVFVLSSVSVYLAVLIGIGGFISSFSITAALIVVMVLFILTLPLLILALEKVID